MALAYTATLTDSHIRQDHTLEQIREHNRVILMDTTTVSAGDQQRQGRQPRAGSVIEWRMRTQELVVCA